MVADAPTVHASAVLTGARAVLIRGGAGAGKSKLALALIEQACHIRYPLALARRLGRHVHQDHADK